MINYKGFVDKTIRLDDMTTGVILPSLVAANLATYSQVGTLITVNNTVAHNIPATTLNGNSVYLTPSSGTLVEGIFTNFQQTGANTFTCVSAISQTISGNLASTTGIKTLKNFTIPGNMMGETGRFEIEQAAQYFNSGNNKIFTNTFGGTTFYTFTATTTGRLVIESGMRNKNATNVQQATCNDTSTGMSTGAGAILTSAIDTTADVTIGLKGTVAAANEWLCIEFAELAVYPSL
jgi:hypothetical protein